MYQFNLDNGIPVIYAGQANEYSINVVIGVGDINEPKPGIANLLEKMILLQLSNITLTFGGNFVVYSSANNDLNTALERTAQIFNPDLLTDEWVEKGQKDIVCQMESMPRPSHLRLRLLYLNTAYNKQTQKDPTQFLIAVNKLNGEDVRQFFNEYYNAAQNIKIVITGPEISEKHLKACVAAFFGHLPKGREFPALTSDIYTGGYGKLISPNIGRGLILGYNIQHLSPEEIPAAFALLSMVAGRVRYAINYGNYQDTWVAQQIYNGYGIRHLRIHVMSHTISVTKMTKMATHSINRLLEKEMEPDRVARAAELAFIEIQKIKPQPENLAMDTIWRLIGREPFNETKIPRQALSALTVDDVQSVAQKVFRHRPPTYVCAAGMHRPINTYNEVLDALNLSEFKR